MRDLQYLPLYMYVHPNCKTGDMFINLKLAWVKVLLGKALAKSIKSSTQRKS